MISNERQHRAAVRQRELLAAELDGLSPAIDVGVAAATETPLATRLLRASLEGQLADLDSEIGEYEALRSGAVARIRATSLGDLPNSLIKARIAAGWTQRELAQRLGLKEQQVQRYESEGYASASIGRLEEVMRALGVEFEAGVELPNRGSTWAGLRKTLVGLGFDRAVIDRRLLRDTGGQTSQSAVLAVADRLARLLNLPVADLVSGNVSGTEFASAVRFKASAQASEEKLFAYARYAEGIAAIVLRATAHLGPQQPVGNAQGFRTGLDAQLLAMGRGASSTPPSSADLFVAAIRHLHSLRVPVIPLRDPGAFHGACFCIDGRVAIVVKSPGGSSSRWANDLIHEAEHSDGVRSSGTRTRLEFGEIGQWSDDPEEIAASNFAADVLFEGRAQPVLRTALDAIGGSVPRLKAALPALARQAEVPVDVLANYLAYQLSSQGINWWPTALTFHSIDTPWRTAVDELLPLLQFAELDTRDRATLMDALAN